MKRRALLALCAALIAAAPAYAAWPERPVRVYTSLPAGTTVDLVARLIATHLNERLKQPFVVENKAGAQGLIAAKTTAAATPDGYTILVAGSISALEATMKDGAGISSELEYVSLVRRSSTYVGMSTKRGFNTLRDMVAWGRDNPKKLNYGSIARTLELYAATINKVSGVDAIHVPFRGTSDAIAALGLGDIDYFLDAPSAFEPLVRQGKAKVVAATTAKRTIDRPDIPGMEEEGLALDLLITYGIVTPKGVPREVVTTLVEEMKAFSARPDMREKYLAMGQGVPVWSTPEEYAAQVKREIVTYQEAAKFIGFNPE